MFNFNDFDLYVKLADHIEVRNDQPLRKNYDYGEGLYSGDMTKYKSVKDFIKSKRKKRKKVLSSLLESGKIV